MADPKGNRLFVNIAASQARTRLKGFGHGVRKIQSAGRNQAIVIHTATGHHREALEAKFADVGFSSDGVAMSEPVQNLRNLGPASGQWLRDVGIRTVADVERLGPVLAYQMVKQRQPQATLNLLWAIAAGLREIDWRELTDVEKQNLLTQLGDE